MGVELAGYAGRVWVVAMQLGIITNDHLCPRGFKTEAKRQIVAWINHTGWVVPRGEYVGASLHDDIEVGTDSDHIVMKVSTWKSPMQRVSVYGYRVKESA